jgi:hypothetical protein
MFETIEKIKALEDKVFLQVHKNEILNIEEVIFFQLSKFIKLQKD